MSNPATREKSIFRRKALGSDRGRGLRRYLSITHLTLMGIGGTIGAGIFVLSGTVAAEHAGPAVTLSFVLAGMGCLCAALCYAEFASLAPSAGGAYAYAYATLGEFPAWIIGWTLVLEYLFSAATVAVGWSGYFGGVAAQFGVHLPATIASAPLAYTAGAGFSASGSVLNLPALAITVGLGVLLARGIGTSAAASNLMVITKIAIVIVVICAGALFVRPANWTPFIPPNLGTFGQFGWSGIFRGAGIVFFAYVGFDMISTSALEARNPQRDLPISLMASLAVCTILYIGMALVMTGLAPFQTLDVPQPLLVALAAAGRRLHWLTPLIGVGALIGLASTMLVSLYGQIRIFYSMSADGLLPRALSTVDPRARVPIFGTVLVIVAAGSTAALFPIQLLGELASIGTLTAFAIVCLGVLVLRKTDPTLPRPFRVPWFPYVPILGIVSCVLLMLTLPLATWIRLLAWTLLGIAIYFGYGKARANPLQPG
jgi:APA family basic amino acid/polyamine antiporter